MTSGDLSLNEWVVLALLAERPAHGFAVARELAPGSDLGRVLTVHRPLVYRALDRVVSAGYAEPGPVEPGDAGPNRTVHRLTRRGRPRVRWWLDQPVAHIRELRMEFLVKVRLLERAGRDPTTLVLEQYAALQGPLNHLVGAEPTTDVVDLWRHHTARAARQFLADLAGGRLPGDEGPKGQPDHGRFVQHGGKPRP
jgi:PadR family transcriptional regulator AphA